MEKTILKLNLKKDIFESIKSNDVSELCLETSPFYFSRLTSNKNNTVEDVKNNPTLFKEFEKVVFTCSGDTCEFDIDNIHLSDEETPQFVLTFKVTTNVETEVQNVVLEETKEIETVKAIDAIDETEVSNDVEENDKCVETVVKDNDNVEKIIETTKYDDINEQIVVKLNGGTDHIDIVEHVFKSVDNEENAQMTFESNDVIREIYNLPKVIVVNKSNVRVSDNGKIYGSEKRLPVKNEHVHVLNLNKTKIGFDNFEDLVNKILELTNKGYLFVNESSIDINESEFEANMYVVTRREMLMW